MIEHWKSIPENQEIQISEVPYKHQGTTYKEDGIRITGSQAFIDSVLSRVKDLLKHENNTSRLQVTYQETKDRETGEFTGTYNSYIQVHERGGQAKHINTAFNLYERA